ncbi:MAG: hypothetical protein KDB00_23710 [Planctomycetales bacterium]|nr:hypothetical protein [Planctomycetales bacterium]
MKPNRLIGTSIIILVVALGGDVTACKVPVFRYALERWPADHYSIVAIVDGELPGEAAEAIKTLESTSKSDVNVTFQVIDLAKLSDDELWSVEGIDDTDQAPMLQVFYPQRDGVRKLCWSGALSAVNVNAWIDSPIRRNIVDDLQAGVTAVWVLVEGQDQSRNAELLAALERQLAIATRSISIPEGVIAREDATRYMKENPGASMDDVLRCDIPLQIKFTIQRVQVEDHNELALRSIAGQWGHQVSAPYAFPVFGRGRMIEPLAAPDFHDDSVTTACRYMVGECSCSVKALNPGVDLILKADWQGKLGDQIVMVDSGELPEPESVPIPAGRDTRTTDDKPVVANNSNGSPGKYLLVAVTLFAVLAFTIKLKIG